MLGQDGWREKRALTAFFFSDLLQVKTILFDVEFKNIYQLANREDGRNNYCIDSLDHSTLFAPQGINGAKKIKYTNVWDGSEIGHPTGNTKASRQFNIADFDGTLSRQGGPRLMGAADEERFEPDDPSSPMMKEWWRLGNCNNRNVQWNMWLCQLNDKTLVGNMQFEVKGLTDSKQDIRVDQSAQIGTVSQFGHSGNNRRSHIVYKTPGITGYTQVGWYFRFLDVGSPSEFTLHPEQIPRTEKHHHYIPIALRYPSNAVVTKFEQDYEWSDRDDATGVEVDSIDKVMDDPRGLSYFFDTSAGDGYGVLYIKLMDLRFYGADPPFDNGYKRQGVVIYDTWSGWRYNIEVDCSGCESTSRSGVRFYHATDVVPPAL
jgi:hypothetical protein